MADNKDDSYEEIKPTNADLYNPPEEQYGEDQAPAVAQPQSRNIVFIIVFLSIIGLLVYLFIGGSDDNESISARTGPQRVPQPVGNITPLPVIDIPEPQIPPAPPQPPQPTTDDTEIDFDPSDNPELRKRLQSGMLITSGIFGSADLGSSASADKHFLDNIYEGANDDDPNIGFADSYFNQKNVPHAYARKLPNMNRLITQGKIVEAILETPINTDIPGMIRGIVSRDVYAESGKKILIPKGSRLIGTYNNFVIRGNKRINIIWSRVIRPDGVDIMLRSGATDQLGRAGVLGEVDNKYMEMFSAAFLVSAINITIAVVADELDNGESGSNGRANDDVIILGSDSGRGNTTATRQAGYQAIDLFGNIAENLIAGMIDMKPSIYIDQGTRVNVFVNRDLLFPQDVTGEVKFIK